MEGGASGAFFIYSGDERYICKTVSRGELATLKRCHWTCDSLPTHSEEGGFKSDKGLCVRTFQKHSSSPLCRLSRTHSLVPTLESLSNLLSLRATLEKHQTAEFEEIDHCELQTLTGEARPFWEWKKHTPRTLAQTLLTRASSREAV